MEGEGGCKTVGGVFFFLQTLTRTPPPPPFNVRKRESRILCRASSFVVRQVLGQQRVEGGRQVSRSRGFQHRPRLRRRA